MAITTDTAARLAHALAKTAAGNEVSDAVNQAGALAAQSLFNCPALIVATNVSTTIDFAALAVGDKVVHIPTVAGNSNFYTVATAGTLPSAAVVGDLYIVLRPLTLPAASAIKL